MYPTSPTFGPGGYSYNIEFSENESKIPSFEILFDLD